MRLDNVLIRLRDTRVYVDFETREVIREFQSKECEYERVRQVGPLCQCRALVKHTDIFQILAGTRDDIPALMRDPNRLSEILPIVEKRSERVVLGG